jgi:hypothetical protein
MALKRSMRRSVGVRLIGALTAGVAGLGLAACDESILGEDPPHVIVADNLYDNLAGFEAGLNALYAQVRLERVGTAGSGANHLRSAITNVGVDNAYANYVSPTERIWNQWEILNHAQEPFYLSIWSWLYETINATNTIVERAENPEIDWTDEEKNEVLAEARLFRAWSYRHLTYLWGDVPLNLTESTGASIRTDWERTPVADVRAQMEADLLFAEQHLPETPASAGHLTRAVAQHYLAELYLTLGRAADAEEKAAAVVNSGNYELITERYGVRAGEPGVPFMDQFADGSVNRSEGNTEVLWALQYELDMPGGGESIMRRYWVNRYYTLGGVAVSEEYGGRAIGRLAATAWAINLYEPEDDRGSHHAIRRFYIYNTKSGLPEGKEIGDTLFLSFEKEKTNNKNWPSTRKWDWTSPDNVNIPRQYNDQPYIRLAETYLLLAEARFEQGDLAGAADAINSLRRRANASEITPAQVTLDFILDERSRELLTEEHRRYTLLRTGTWLERTRAHNPLAGAVITERDALFPIPQAVIDANLDAVMPQNPGY